MLRRLFLLTPLIPFLPKPKTQWEKYLDRVAKTWGRPLTPEDIEIIERGWYRKDGKFVLIN
jgi:hypothetical protein